MTRGIEVASELRGARLRVLALARSITRDVDMLPVRALRRAFDALVARTCGPVLLVDAEMSVLVANHAGRAWLAGRSKQDLHAAARGEHAEFEVTVVDPVTQTWLFVGRPRRASGELAARVEAAAWRWRLTARQQEVLRLIVQGEPDKLIAEELGISVATVAVHVRAILRASGTTSRARVASAVNGLIPPEPPSSPRPRER